MNERILALVEQAWAADCLENNPKWKRTDITDLIMKDCAGFHKKFADLIVRECVSICEINGQSYKHSFTPAKARLAESTSNHCAMIITKHFGVE